MNEESFNGIDKRQFVRLDYSTPLAYKVCKEETVSKLLKGYTSNVSEAGLLCNIKDRVNKDDILWLSFDRATLNICEELEKRSLIYQNGVIGKVARVDHKNNGSYDVGIQFLVREEKNVSNIYPKVHFLCDNDPINYAGQDRLDRDNEMINEQNNQNDKTEEI